jgi:hypothetical protein
VNSYRKTSFMFLLTSKHGQTEAEPLLGSAVGEGRRSARPTPWPRTWPGPCAEPRPARPPSGSGSSSASSHSFSYIDKGQHAANNLAFIRGALILPKISEPFRGKLSVAHGVLDVLVTEVVLKRPGIHTLVCQLVAG